MLYLITGINGVGKSRFINELIDTTDNFCSISASAELMKELKIKAGGYEELRNFDSKIKNDIFKKIILDASREYSNSLSLHAVMDAHILNIKEGEIAPVMDNSMIKLFTAVVYLYAKTSDILERIEQDNSGRDRYMFKKTGKPENTKVLDFYGKKFEETLRRECLIAGTLLQGIPHLKNKTYLAVQTFNVLHKQILDGNSPSVGR